MAIESINREFEVFMRDMMNAQECAHKNIESELRSLIRTTVNSCATLYGFSAKEALAKLDSNGNILPQISEIPSEEDKKQKRLKELEKAERVLVKEAQKAHKAEIKAFEKAEKQRRFAFESAKKCQEKAEKANERSERNQMKDQDIASKAIEKAEKQISLKNKKKTVTKKVKGADCESLASTVIMTDSEDEEIHILFQNLPLIEELNSIRNIKVQKKLSAGVKLARQVLDI